MRGLMSEGSSWRSIPTADQYRQHDYADFAQEFLQRNHDYRRDHAATLNRITCHPEITQAEEEGLAGRWGLSFPHPSVIRSKGQPRAMVTNRRTRCGSNRDRRHRGNPAIARF